LSYHGLGLLSGLGARPGWCPTSTYNAEHPPQDPCEIRYSVDLPIVGRTDMALPIDQMTNDAIIGAVKVLPATLDSALPTIYSKAQPYINNLLADAQSTAEDALQHALNTIILPQIEKQKEEVLAQAETLRDEALKTVLAVGVMIVVAVGAAAWWIKS